MGRGREADDEEEECDKIKKNKKRYASTVGPKIVSRVATIYHASKQAVRRASRVTATRGRGGQRKEGCCTCNALLNIVPLCAFPSRPPPFNCSKPTQTLTLSVSTFWRSATFCGSSFCSATRVVLLGCSEIMAKMCYIHSEKNHRPIRLYVITFQKNSGKIKRERKGI